MIFKYLQRNTTLYNVVQQFYINRLCMLEDTLNKINFASAKSEMASSVSAVEDRATSDRKSHDRGASKIKKA